jgi:L-threonylcarbamoyladenylate synthase
VDQATIVRRAVDELAQGRIVAIPTETVYGLAAAIDQPQAIESIFTTKARPQFDPLIVHVFDEQQAKTLVTDWPTSASILAKAFWPGPLTLILNKNDRVSDLITAGHPSVGLRAPAHALTREILRGLRVPIAAPSANRFTRTSPTQAAHVRAEFPGAKFLIVDGGPCEVGIESTVLDLTQDLPQILRPGMITAQQIEAVLNQKVLHSSSESSLKLSPGTFREHYRPEIPLVITDEHGLSAERLQEIAQKLQLKDQTSYEIPLSESPQKTARLLYAELQALKSRGVSFAWVKKTSEQKDEHWRAIWNRLEKAASINLMIE